MMQLLIVKKMGKEMTITFHPQAHEQLKAWLGGFENILKRITLGNFNWFLHLMLFCYTRHVINKGNRKADN
jgi:hypothetical protein